MASKKASRGKPSKKASRGKQRTRKTPARKNPFTHKVNPDGIEIRKGRALVLSIRQGIDVQPDQSEDVPVFQVDLIFDCGDRYCDPADFIISVVVVKEDGYSLLRLEVDSLAEGWPVFAKLKGTGSWAVQIEDAAVDAFKNVVKNFAEVEDPNPHMGSLKPYVHEYESELRALVRRAMVDRILRTDLIGDIFVHCATEAIDSIVEDVHDY